MIVLKERKIFSLGLGLKKPWEVTSQYLDTDQNSYELHLELAADRGSLFSCPECGKQSKAHDFKERRWRHLNFFQHYCLLKAKVLRIRCPKHRVKRIVVPWAREGSRFTLLFEQVVMSLVREMPVAAARWRMTHFLNHARSILTDVPELEAIRKILNTHLPHSTAVDFNLLHCPHRRPEFLISGGSLKSKRRYNQTFITMIYLIAAPICFFFNSS